VCIRVPPAISKRSRIASRSSKQYQKSEIAPSSRAEVPSQTRCEWIRFSSASAIRAHTARRGASIPRSFSMASTYRSSFAWKET
jgi:hypothetical protein